MNNNTEPCGCSFESCTEFIARRGFASNGKIVTFEKGSHENDLAVDIDQTYLEVKDMKYLLWNPAKKQKDYYSSIIERRDIPLLELKSSISRHTIKLVAMWEKLTSLFDEQVAKNGNSNCFRVLC
jgi:hypothetical protein